MGGDLPSRLKAHEGDLGEADCEYGFLAWSLFEFGIQVLD